MFKVNNKRHQNDAIDVFREPCQTSKMKTFAKKNL